MKTMLRKIGLGLAMYLLLALPAKLHAQFAQSFCNTNLGCWYSGDLDFVENNGSGYATWGDQSQNSLDLVSGQNDGPFANTSGINFHQTIRFTAGRHIYKTGVNSSLIRNSNAVTMYYVGNITGDVGESIFTHGEGANRMSFEGSSARFGGNSSNFQIDFNQRIGSTFEFKTVLVDRFPGGRRKIKVWKNSKYENIKDLGDNTFALSVITDTLEFGDFTGVLVQNFEGNIGEFVLFADDHNNSTMTSFWSYLSLKFGISMDSTELDYRNSNSNLIWQHTACNKTNYSNRITGIFRDDCFGYEQDKSRNQATDRILTGALGSIASDFSQTPSTFTDNYQSFLWGDDDGAVTLTTSNLPSGIDNRIERIWKVSEFANTGTVGTVSFQFSLYGYVSSGLNKEQVYIIVDDDASSGTVDFTDEDSTTSGTVFHPTTWDPNTNVGTFQYDFDDCDAFTIAFRNGATVPVQFDAFNGEINGHVAQLHWSTASELNSDRFEIQRSTDNNTWETLGTVEAAGFSRERLHYNFTDVNPHIGYNYYRIRQIDNSGEDEYSAIVALAYLGDDVLRKVSIYPNPNQGQFSVEIPDFEGFVDVDIQDMLGRTVQEFTMHGGSVLKVNNLDKGIYFVNITKGKDKQVIRVIVRD